MPAKRRTAVSYSRFSDPSQSAGDSSDRQERNYRDFCQRHNLTPGKEVFADRGKSGYSGEHRTKGQLGLLIQAAKDGRFEPGTVVVIEAWDRLGRLRPDKQTELVAELLRTGVSIGVCRLNEIFSEDDFGTHKWTTLAVFIQLAHQESKQKAERVASAWQRRRERAREAGAWLGHRHPAWLEAVDGRLRLIPDRAEAVRLIFKLAAEGMGRVRIIKELVKRKTPPFGAKAIGSGRTRSQFLGEWSNGFVGALLADRRVIGEFQPRKGKKPDGPPLIGFYPAVLSPEEFALARAAQEKHFGLDTLQRRKAARQRQYVNVFNGMLVHARDGEGFVIQNRGTAAEPKLLLLNSTGRGGRSRNYTFDYSTFEAGILSRLKELDPASILPRESGEASKADALRAKLAGIREDIAGLQASLQKKFSPALVEVLHRIEADEERVANDLQDELARTAKPLKRSWGELPTLIDFIHKADDPDRARLQLRAALRPLVSEIRVLIVPRHPWQLAAVQFFFTGGGTRSFLLARRSAGNGRPERVANPQSFDAKLPPLDMRKPADVAKFEKLLDSLELESVK